MSKSMDKRIRALGSEDLRTHNKTLRLMAAHRAQLIEGMEEEIEKLIAENQRLKEYAKLVETATEAEDANGIPDDHGTTITLHFSWFQKARTLLAAGDKEVRDE